MRITAASDHLRPQMQILLDIAHRAMEISKRQTPRCLAKKAMRA